MKLAFLLIAAIACAQAQTPAPSQTPTGSLSGTVIDSVTHQPIKKARVSALCSSPNGGMQNHAASTDSTGTFLFDNNLPPGNCFLSANHQDYPQVGPNRPKSIQIAPSEKNGPVTLDLVPGASFSGRIVDEDGDPIAGCFVQAHPAAQPSQAMQAGSANGSGEYHVTKLAAGKYVVSAQCMNDVFQPRPFSAGPDPPPSRAYPEQYYPLAPDAKAAQPIMLAAGTEKPAIDFQMRPAPVTQVKGTLIEAGEPVKNSNGLIVQLIAVDQSGGFYREGAVRNNDKGTFEFRTVFPGSYYLVAWTNGQDAKGASAFERIEVKDRPIDTLLDVKPGININGVVTLDNDNQSSQIQLNQVRIQLIPDMQAVRAPNVAANADGSFTLESVPLWRWRLLVSGPLVYLKSAYLGPTDITHDTFDTSAGAAGEMRIVLGTNLGTISGTGPAGQMIWAAQDDPRLGNRAAQIDSTGHFTIQQIPPGTYRVSTSPPYGAMQDDNAIQVTVKEGETVTVEIKS